MKKNYSIELLRFIAACGIIWFHIKAPGSSVAYSGLPIFAIFAIFFVDSQLNIVKKINRLILPWFFWSIIYGLLKISENLLTGNYILHKIQPYMILTGFSLHLWFLPYIFCMELLVYYFINKFPIQKSYLSNNLFAFLCGGMFLFSSYMLNHISKDFIPLPQWTFITPSILFGIFLSSINYKRNIEELLKNGVWIILLFLGIFYQGSLQPQYIIAFLLCLIALEFPMKENKIIKQLGSLSYGLYLVHILFVIGWKKIGIPDHGFSLVFLTIVSSTIFVFVFKRTKLVKFL